MSILLTKILWFSVDNLSSSGIYTGGVNITDSVKFDSSRGLDIKNNIIDIDLKNNAEKLDASENIIHKHIDEGTFESKFQENDQIKVYVRYTDDASVNEETEWQDNNLEPNSQYLLGTFFVTDYKLRQGQNGQSVSLKCIDKTAVIFNKLLAKQFPKETTSSSATGVSGLKLIDSSASFTDTANVAMRVTNTTTGAVSFVTGVDDDTTLSINDNIFTSTDNYKLEWTAPAIIQKAIRFSSESQNGIKEGSGTDPNVRYDVGAKTVSEGGFIQDQRRATTETGTTNTDRAFPAITFAKVWKPVYEWIAELSGIDNINDIEERDGTDPIVYGRSFLYYIDEDNNFHWMENSQTVDTIIDIDTDDNIYSLSLTFTVFDSINFIVYRGGQDLKGTGTLGYEVDETTGAKNLKMRVVAMTDIAREFIEQEISDGHIVEDLTTPGPFTFGGTRYSVRGVGYGFTSSWGVDTTGFTDNQYNESLREAIASSASNRARQYLLGLTGQRFKGSMEIKGQIITPGSLYNITDTDTGIVSQDIRVKTVRHNINNEGWFTTLTLEQDADAIVLGE